MLPFCQARSLFLLFSRGLAFATITKILLNPNVEYNTNTAMDFSRSETM